jgi:hypothetical protein
MRSVFAVDVGSLGNVGWARFASGQPPEGSRSLSALVVRLAADAANGWSLALGFEAPGFLPIPEDSTSLNRARPGEGDRPWCFGAGAYTTAVGIQQSAWVVRTLASRAAATHDITTDWLSWPPARGQRPVVLLWEAFSKAAHSPTNDLIEDAGTAAHAFPRTTPLARDPRSRDLRLAAGRRLVGMVNGFLPSEERALGRPPGRPPPDGDSGVSDRGRLTSRSSGPAAATVAAVR